MKSQGPQLTTPIELPPMANNASEAILALSAIPGPQLTPQNAGQPPGQPTEW